MDIKATEAKEKFVVFSNRCPVTEKSWWPQLYRSQITRKDRREYGGGVLTQPPSSFRGLLLSLKEISDCSVEITRKLRRTGK